MAVFSMGCLCFLGPLFALLYGMVKLLVLRSLLWGSLLWSTFGYANSSTLELERVFSTLQRLSISSESMVNLGQISMLLPTLQPEQIRIKLSRKSVPPETSMASPVKGFQSVFAETLSVYAVEGRKKPELLMKVRTQGDGLQAFSEVTPGLTRFKFDSSRVIAGVSIKLTPQDLEVLLKLLLVKFGTPEELLKIPGTRSLRLFVNSIAALVSNGDPKVLHRILAEVKRASGPVRIR